MLNETIDDVMTREAIDELATSLLPHLKLADIVRTLRLAGYDRASIIRALARLGMSDIDLMDALARGLKISLPKLARLLGAELGWHMRRATEAARWTLESQIRDTF